MTTLFLNSSRKEGPRSRGLSSDMVFSGGEIHIVLDELIQRSPEIDIVAEVLNSEDFMRLIMTSSTCFEHGIFVRDIIIPYLPYGRQDRRTVDGGSRSLHYAIRLLQKSAPGSEFKTFMTHSTVTTALDFEEVGVDKFNREVIHYLPEDFVVVAPDLGAVHRASVFADSHGKELVIAKKHRDPATGRLTFDGMYGTINPEKHYVIYDDLADGGGTFAQLLDATDIQHASLVVGHGIFSKGLEPLDKFENIVTTSTFPQVGREKRIEFLTLL